MRQIVSILVLFLIVIQLDAADCYECDSLIAYQRIDASYIFGFQGSDDNLTYNPGISFQNTYGVMINRQAGLGCGFGFQSLKNARFIPLYFELIGYKKNKENAPFIKMQVGYAIGWYEGSVSADGYKYKGGVFIDAGMGRKVQLKNDLSLFFHWSYRHQFAKMEYEIFNAQNYSEILNYDMLVISFSLIREQ